MSLVAIAIVCFPILYDGAALEIYGPDESSFSRTNPRPIYDYRRHTVSLGYDAVPVFPAASYSYTFNHTMTATVAMGSGGPTGTCQQL